MIEPSRERLEWAAKTLSEREHRGYRWEATADELGNPGVACLSEFTPQFIDAFETVAIAEKYERDAAESERKTVPALEVGGRSLAPHAGSLAWRRPGVWYFRAWDAEEGEHIDVTLAEVASDAARRVVAAIEAEEERLGIDSAGCMVGDSPDAAVRAYERHEAAKALLDIARKAAGITEGDLP